MRKEYETPEIVVEKFTVYDVTTASSVGGAGQQNQEDTLTMGSLEEF